MASLRFVLPFTVLFVLSIRPASPLSNVFKRRGSVKYRGARGATPLDGDLLGVCGLYGCGRVRQHKPHFPFMKGRQTKETKDSIAVECAYCKPEEVNDYGGLDNYCMPVERNGTVKLPKDWISLASAAHSVPSSTKLGKDETMRLSADNWVVFHADNNELLDFTSCSANSNTDTIELQFIMFLGTPTNFSGKHSLSYEVVAKQNKEYTPEVNKIGRRWFGNNWKLGKEQALVYVRRTVVSLAQSFELHPEDIFEARVTCKDRRCRVGDYYACFLVACREAGVVELTQEAIDMEINRQVDARLEEAAEHAIKRRNEIMEQRLRDYEDAQNAQFDVPESPQYLSEVKDLEESDAAVSPAVSAAKSAMSAGGIDSDKGLYSDMAMGASKSVRSIANSGPAQRSRNSRSSRNSMGSQGSEMSVLAPPSSEERFRMIQEQQRLQMMNQRSAATSVRWRGAATFACLVVAVATSFMSGSS